MKKILLALLLLIAPATMASDPHMTFRSQIILGNIVLTPIRPIKLLADKIEGPAIAPDDIIDCSFKRVDGEGIVIRCGKTTLLFAGLAIESD